MSEEKKRSINFRPFKFITGKIRNKLIAILVGIALGTLFVAAVAIVSMQLSGETLTEVIDEDGKVVQLANEAYNDLLLAREQDQQYLLNYRRLGFENARGEYVDQVLDYAKRVTEVLAEIEAIEPDEQDNIEQIATIRTGLQQYQSSFLEVVKGLETRGAKDVGIVGELRSISIEIEQVLDDFQMNDLKVELLTVRRNEKDYLLRGDRRYIRDTSDSIEQFKDKLLTINFDPATKDELNSKIDSYGQKFEALVQLDRQIADQARIYRSAIGSILPTLTTMVEVELADQERAIAELKEINRVALIVVVSVTGFTLLVGILAAIFFSRRLTKQIDNIMEMFGNIGIGDFSARADVISQDELGEMAESLNAMLDNTLTLIQSRDERDAIQNSIMNLLMEISDLAEGDLTARAEVTEEITGALADSFNTMAEQLSQVVRDVKEASALVGSSSQDVDQVTKRLAERSEEQAAKIQEAITTIEDMATKMREVSNNAAESAKVSDKALSSAKEGSDAVKKTNEAMGSIKENMRSTARTIKRLGESSQEIGNIVQIINDIADRTSILALNASIQAAMAGDAGRGFAVVAEEVQRLAERSAESTKQIESLINSIQGDISAAGTSMETSIQYVVDGTELADQAHNKLDEIESVSNQLAEIIASISTSAQEQSVESENVTSMMQVVGDLTSQTSEATKETTASMEKITTTSKQLEESIAVFKVAE